MFIGFLIVALGVLMLLKSAGIIGGIGEYIGPIAIIAVGLHIAFGDRCKRERE
ncbi:MAG TPA: hypothetical protein VLB27_00170 [candidate division Zixibacteria bacterium]|nr:hypothetical protein [candidate division Zixibacteria bacterium]